MFDALLFDLDGTLIDTEKLAMTSGMAAFAAAGHPVAVDFLHGLIGIDQPSARQIIRTHVPALDFEMLDRFWREGFRAEVDRGLTLKPGVLDMLALAGGRPCALVTSSGRGEALHKLGITGLSDAFAQVITLDDVQNPKPEPEPYLLAARLLGVEPHRCLVFEDSETGAQSAHRAGCRVVQVPDIVPASGRWAHHVAADLLAGARLAGLV